MSCVAVRIPSPGEAVREVTLARWLRAPGAIVAAGEPLLEIETEKASTAIEAPAAGLLADVVATDGARVAVGATVASLYALRARRAPRLRDEALSPLVRRLLAEHGLPAGAIRGTGPGGRITKQDIEAHLAALSGRKP